MYVAAYTIIIGAVKLLIINIYKHTLKIKLIYL